MEARDAAPGGEHRSRGGDVNATERICKKRIHRRKRLVVCLYLVVNNFVAELEVGE